MRQKIYCCSFLIFVDRFGFVFYLLVLIEIHIDLITCLYQRVHFIIILLSRLLVSWPPALLAMLSTKNSTCPLPSMNKIKIRWSSMLLLTTLLTNLNSSQALNSIFKILKMPFFPNNSKLFKELLRFLSSRLLLHSSNSRMLKR